MPGLVPGIHAFRVAKAWMAGTSPAMTLMGRWRSYKLLAITSFMISLVPA
jgi:hypothetical protein